jgi:hypothetical protein
VQGWSADNSNDPLRSPKAPQIQINPLQIGLDDLAAQRAQLFLGLVDFPGNALQREFNVSHSVLLPSGASYSVTSP